MERARMGLHCVQKAHELSPHDASVIENLINMKAATFRHQIALDLL